MDVSIIIINYNSIQLTSQCLDSIFGNCRDIIFEIILIDNASTDNSVSIIKDKFPEIILIQNSENIGFGRANNIGIKKASGKYLFFLNPDTVLLNNAIRIFFDYMEKHNIKEDIGAIGCVLLDQNRNLNYRNSYYYFPHLSMHFDEYFLKVFNIQRNRYINDKKDLNGDGSISVEFIVGADLFIPKTVIQEIGDFDPDYFLYWEEVDLQYRMYKKQLKRLIISGPEILHLEGGSSRNVLKNSRRILEMESLIKYFRKHTNKVSVLSTKGMLLIFNLLTIFNNRYTLNEQIKYCQSILKA